MEQKCWIFSSKFLIQITFFVLIDGGVCVEHNLLYPNCNLIEAYKFGDGICDHQFNTIECGYDQHDCCPYDESDTRFGDGLC